MSRDPLREAFEDFEQQVSAQLADVQRRLGERRALGDHPDDERIDCDRCGNCLGLRSISTSEVRVHYNGFALRFTPREDRPLVLHCRRCGFDQDRHAAD